MHACAPRQQAAAAQPAMPPHRAAQAAASATNLHTTHTARTSSRPAHPGCRARPRAPRQAPLALGTAPLSPLRRTAARCLLSTLIGSAAAKGTLAHALLQALALLKLGLLTRILGTRRRRHGQAARRLQAPWQRAGRPWTGAGEQLGTARCLGRPQAAVGGVAVGQHGCGCVLWR